MVFNPLLKTLHANAPDAILTVLAPKSLVPLIRLFPGADEIVSVNDAFYIGGDFGFDADQALSKEYDVVIDTLCTEPCVTMMRRLVARTKIGINFTPGPSPYSLEIPPFSAVENRSAIDCYLDYARAMHVPVLDDSTAIDPRRLMPICDPSIGCLVNTLRSETSIGLLLAGGDWHKRYPSTLVTELIRVCPFKYSLVLLYGPSEADEYSTHLDEWQLARNQRLHAVAGTDLGDTIHILRACSGALGNDCGLMHIAVALGLPTLSLFGPSEPTAWFPYRNADTQRFLVARAPCRPCYGDDRECCTENLCMAEFTPARIWAEFASLRIGSIVRMP